MADDVSSADGDAPLQLSERVRDVLLGARESWTRRMFELGAQLRRSGSEPVWDLSLGNPSLEPPARFRDAVLALMQAPAGGNHRYMTNAGYPEVRAFVAAREGARYGLALTAAHVTITVGAAGALNVLFGAMLDPGDEVVVPAPYFSEYDHYCANVGARVVAVPTGPGFHLDAERVLAAIGPRTRMVLINSPNNPTGAVYGQAELDDLAQRLRARSCDRTRPIFVVEDSPYRDMLHDGTPAPALFGRYDHALLVSSHSKDLGLAGERIGYLMVSPTALGAELIARAAAYCTRVLGFVNAPALMQRVLPLLLADPPARVDVSVYARNCARMAAGLRALGFELPEPRAGFFLFPALPPALRDRDGSDVALTERLARERTLVVPGTAFGVPGHLRLSLAVEDATIDGALAAFQRALG